MNKLKILGNDLEDYVLNVSDVTLQYDTVKAVGTNILVELLTANEVYNSTIKVSNDSKVTALQGIILDIGPCLNAAEWGIAVGDRVVLWGEYLPVTRPKHDKGHRDLAIYAPHCIKAILKKNK